MKSRCHDVKQAEAIISGGLICQKTGIIFKVEEVKTTSSIQQCFKCQDFGHNGTKLYKQNRNVLCVVIPTKTVQTKKKEVQNVLIVGNLMSLSTEVVLLTRIKPSGNM